MDIIAGKLFGVVGKLEQAVPRTSRHLDAEKFTRQYASYFTACAGPDRSCRV